MRLQGKVILKYFSPSSKKCFDFDQHSSKHPEQRRRTPRGLKYFIVFSVLMWFTYQPMTARAASLGTLGLKTSLSYDIYFGGNEKTPNVIRDVNLVRTAEIEGRIFLVIESDGFKLKKAEGFVRLDAVLAFVPHTVIGVQKANEIKF